MDKHEYYSKTQVVGTDDNPRLVSLHQDPNAKYYNPNEPEPKTETDYQPSSGDWFTDGVQIVSGLKQNVPVTIQHLTAMFKMVGRLYRLIDELEEEIKHLKEEPHEPRVD